MPPALDHVVRKCLEKDPADRWQSAHDVASELRWIGEAGSQAGVPTSLALRRRSRERLAWALVAALAAAVIAGWGWALQLRRTMRAVDQPFRVELVPPAEIRIASVLQGALALSPDGARLAFVSRGDGPSVLIVRALASGETRTLAGTEGATFPFWSPDSRSLAFFAQERLKKVAAEGGPIQIVCEAHAGRGGSWGKGGTIVFAPDITGPLMKVPAGGGTPAPVTRAADQQATHRNPWFLPDGRHFLFTLREAGWHFGAVAVGTLDGGEPRVVLERGSNPQYADGVLLSVVDGNLVAQGFDADRQALEGQALPIAAAVEYYNPRDLGHFSVSGAGLLVYRQARLRRTQLVWLDRAGKELAKVGEPSYYAGLHLAPGGRTLAAVRSDSGGADSDVWVLDLQRPQATRSTFVSARNDVLAALSPDGTQLAVWAEGGAGRKGSTLWIQPTSGSGTQQPLQERTSFNVTGWSPDGALLVGATQEAETGFDVAYLALADPSKIVRLTSSRFNEVDPALSPDGRWIAYSSDETGRSEVFVCDFPKAARKWQVSRSGGEAPTWRDDSREVYFTGPDGVTATSVSERAGAFEVGAPERLPIPRDAFRLGYGARSPDGKRFLVERFDSEAYTEPIRLIRSWRRLVEK
jgi:Tol biopolymer transport system component